MIPHRPSLGALCDCDACCEHACAGCSATALPLTVVFAGEAYCPICLAREAETSSECLAALLKARAA